MPAARIEDLTCLDFFRGLEPTELRALAARAHTRRLEPGQMLFIEGDPLEPTLRFVLAGRLEIRKTAASGKETVIRLIREGEIFGAAALFDRQLAPGTALAAEPTTVLEIPGEDLLRHLAEHPAIALKLLVTFAGRLRETQEALHAVVSGRGRARLARQILVVLDRDGATAGPEGLRLHTRLPHATLSRMVGLAYEECIRLVREWTHDPAILKYERGGVITVFDRAALDRIARDLD